MNDFFASARKGNASILAYPWPEAVWWVGLWLVALPLYLWNLGGVALRDWDEAIVAQVAREIWRGGWDSLVWLYPTLNGEPYLNKPPFLHWLIAGAYQVLGVSEWSARLPGAVLAAAAVPLLYGIGRELLRPRSPAVLMALVYLTLLPVVRHGRLAMLDGALITSFLVLVYCLLRSRRNLRWGLGVGLALSALLLLKGLVAVLLGAIALGFVLWDTPRLATSVYLWGGVLLGLTPALTWYGFQWLHYGSLFFTANLVQQSLNRVWDVVEQNSGPPWFYLWELLKYGAPWLLFLPWAVRLAWDNRLLSWAKLGLVWLSLYFLVISVMETKLPWYVLPLYPAIALLVGIRLAQSWQPTDLTGVRVVPRQPEPPFWWGALGVLAIATGIGSVYFSPFGVGQPWLQLILLALALALGSAAILLRERDSQFIPMLLWGCYVALLLFVASPYWNWELNESFPVKPVAALIQQNTPTETVIWSSQPNYRPSLTFYSDRPVYPANDDLLAAIWARPPEPYLLLDDRAIAALQLPAAEALGTAEGWHLYRRQTSPAAIAE